MAWLAITLQADAEAAESLADALVEAGALSVTVDDADAGTPDEAAQFAEPGLAAPRAWPRNVLTILVAEDADPAAILAEAAQACGQPVPAYRVEPVADQDWVRATQAQFEPIRVTEGLWIVPSWCESPEPEAINIAIDPGLAFGTGSHATTRLVLRWLSSTLRPGQSVLDYGCGSGILAIAAGRLGAGDAWGVDIDPQALIAARDNATKNGVTAAFFTPEAAPDRPAEILVANILANPLVVLAPLLASRSTGRIALSGVLESQAGEVIAAYAPYFDARKCESEDGWVLIEGERRMANP
jgi:ribosomal protein L11 methyltransferase